MNIVGGSCVDTGAMCCGADDGRGDRADRWARAAVPAPGMEAKEATTRQLAERPRSWSSKNKVVIIILILVILNKSTLDYA